MIHCFSSRDCLAFRAHAKENPPEGQTNPFGLAHASSCLRSSPSSLSLSSAHRTQHRWGFAHPLKPQGIFQGCPKALRCPPIPSGSPHLAVLCTGASTHGAEVCADRVWGWTLLPKRCAQSRCLCANDPVPAPCGVYCNSPEVLETCLCAPSHTPLPAGFLALL